MKFAKKKILLGQKCLLKSNREEGIKLIKQARDLAIEYDFLNLASEAASILYNHHVYYQQSRRKANVYRQESEQCLSNYLAGKKAEHTFWSVVQQLGRSTKPKVIETAIEQLEENPGTSLRYRSYLAILQVLYGLHILNYQMVIQSCSKALQAFEKEKGFYISHQQFFLSKLGTAQMAIRDHERAANSFQKAREFTQAKSYNDYLLRYYETLNAIQTGQYLKAYELFRQNRRCKFESIREQFAIIEAYLCYLSYTGHLQTGRVFRLGKYLNDTFKAQADKQGDNINILIAELLVYLARDRGKFIDRIEAIQHYSYRHLNNKEVRRAKWFIKILCLLPSVDFHPIALARRGKSYIAKLEQHPVSMGENFAIEIIPFEDLLGMIMRQLERQVA